MPSLIPQRSTRVGMACSQAIEFQPTLNCQPTIWSSQAFFVSLFDGCRGGGLVAWWPGGLAWSKGALFVPRGLWTADG